MRRLGAIFIAICMVLIAASLGGVLYLTAGLSVTEAAVVAIAALAGMALYNAVSGRLQDHRTIANQIAGLSGGIAELARQVTDFGRRLAAVEAKLNAAADRPHASMAPLAAEIEELGTLVRHLAESVAAQDSVLASLATQPPATLETAAQSASRAAMVAPPAADDAPTTVAELTRVKRLDISFVKDAVDANRIDLYLQPVVTLPQRKVRYYEAVSRLRTEDGGLVPAADFIGPAEDGRLMPKIDNLLLFRCVQIVRRLLLKNREIGLFCNVSATTLTDPASFPQFLEFMEANRAIAPSLILEFTHSAFRAMGPMELESLAALADRGFRFSLDNVVDLRIEPRDLADRGFRFIKIPAPLLLDRTTATTATDIHAADMANLLGRFGIDLIAEKIESEGMVVDLLDHDVRYGQGFLFSAPRPVRQEALQGVADRNDLIVRDVSTEPPPAPRPPTPPPAGRRGVLAQIAGGKAGRA